MQDRTGPAGGTVVGRTARAVPAATRSLGWWRPSTRLRRTPWLTTARARKIADRIKVLIAANLESIVKDPDLGFVTITDVRVTGDLQHASVFYTVFGDDAPARADRRAAREEQGQAALVRRPSRSGSG